jgi:pyruvate/2-oxoglutarate/acetoin dehydrogenase E1 component
VHGERVVENLGRAHHELMAADRSVVLIGEDLLDPYGGAFKVARGLSTAFPDRVLTTPISEAGLTGFAAGLALAGRRPIVEIMFGDFISLAFDQIWNFLAKSVTMYGRRLELNAVIRCPVGGNRGYGATHSQSPQKHFIGIPDLELYEVSPFHDTVPLLARLAGRGSPVLLFEDKTLYTRRMLLDEQVNELLTRRLVEGVDPGGCDGWAHVLIDGDSEPDAVIIAPGGLVSRCLDAVEELLVEHELEVELLVPQRLYPFDPTPVLPILDRASNVLVIEEGPGGGTWGTEVAVTLYERARADGTPGLARQVHRLSSADSIIPCARHLEQQVLVQTADIVQAVITVAGGEEVPHA